MVTLIPAIDTSAGKLHTELRTLIASRRQRLVQFAQDCITVAEYWTELPPKAEPEQKLHAALLEARERLARRGVLLGTWMRSDDLKVGKGLGFPVVGLAGVRRISAKGKGEQEAARVFYVAATRATQRWDVGAGGEFGRLLSIGIATAHGIFPTLG